MNIKILKDSQGFDGVILNHRKAIEIKSQKSQYPGINQERYYIFDLETNVKEEILPKIKKFNIVKIEDSIKDSDFILFSSIVSLEKNNVQIQIIKYYYLTEEYETIHSFTDNLILFPKEKRIRVFPLNDIYVIIQTELLKSNINNNYKGFFDFEISMYNTKENHEIKIVDQNLLSNGIGSLTPISETHNVIKTGYSLFEDRLFEKLLEEEICVESISVINTQQLISDILLNSENLLQETINQAHFTTSFSPIMVREDYLVYSIINFQSKEEDINFYNFLTKENVSCRNQNIEEPENLAKTYVIDNMPYVKLYTERGTEFYNIIRGKVDIIFESDVEVNQYVNNIFIVSRIIKRTKRKTKSVLSIYKYPGMTLLHDEKALYSGCVNVDKDNIHVFVK